MKKIIAVFAALLCIAAQAQTIGTQTQTFTDVDSGARAEIAPGAVSITSISNGNDKLKTTGQAIAPGIYNSSGQYTCFGGASAALGWMGGSVGGGKTVGQFECYRLFLMDKYQARASAASKAAADTLQLSFKAEEKSKERESLAIMAGSFQDQANKWTRAWEALACGFDMGSEAMTLAGMECPQDEKKRMEAAKKAEAQAIAAEQAGVRITGPVPAGWQGANLADPVIAERAAKQGVPVQIQRASNQ